MTKKATTKTKPTRRATKKQGAEIISAAEADRLAAQGELVPGVPPINPKKNQRVSSRQTKQFMDLIDAKYDGKTPLENVYMDVMFPEGCESLEDAIRYWSDLLGCKAEVALEMIMKAAKDASPFFHQKQPKLMHVESRRLVVSTTLPAATSLTKNRKIIDADVIPQEQKDEPDEKE